MEPGPSRKWQPKFLTPTELESIMNQYVNETAEDHFEFDTDSEDDQVIEDFRSENEPDNLQVNENQEKSKHPHEGECEIDPVSEEEDQDANEEDQDANEERASNDNYVRIIETPARLYGKNKFKWSGIKPKTVRRPRRNLVTHLPGNKGDGRNVKSSLEAFCLYFDNTVMENIVKFTNAEIDAQRRRYTSDRTLENDDDIEPTSVRPSFTKHTNVIELNALFGLYYLSGVLNMNHVTTAELFDKFSGVSYFRATMPQARFEYLTNCLRFDDRNTRDQRRNSDRLAPIRELFDHIIKRCQDLYTPSEYCTVDEQLLAFRGRCPFKIYIPSKPDKYGIKIVMMCDAKTFYMINGKVYMGKGSTPEGQPLSEYYSIELTKPIHGTNRNCTFDNWFTSVPTAQKLLHDHNITVVGTMKINKPEIPQSFRETSGRSKNTAMFAFSKELTLLSYCPPKSKTKKIVTLLSTMHDTADTNSIVTLPEMIEFYNSTKGGVDTFDQLCHRYSVSRRTRRWPLCIFYGILNLVGINTAVLLNGSCSKNKEVYTNRRLYLKNLALSLMKPHMAERLRWPTLPTYLRETIRGILKLEVPEEQPAPRATGVGRCRFCHRSRDRKSRTSCDVCKEYICADHQRKICPKCFEGHRNS